VICKVLLFG